MIFLFRSGTYVSERSNTLPVAHRVSVREKLLLVLKATRQHARNLASFAFLYKAMMILLRKPRGQSYQDKEASYDTFLAGLVSGYVVFGKGIQSSVNQQIVIYVFARAVLGLAKLGIQNEHIPSRWRFQISEHAWPAFAAINWGLVMWLFRWYPDTLQPSLKSSMKYM